MKNAPVFHLQLKMTGTAEAAALSGTGRLFGNQWNSFNRGQSKNRTCANRHRTRITSRLLNINETDEKGTAMKRKAPLKYDNAIGCVRLWAAATRPDRRTTVKWLRVAIRERNRKAKLQ